jgi:biofilm protein TabA
MIAAPDKFFLFFPGDWHIAKVSTPTQEDQNIRVVVVKVDYIK